MQQMTTVHVIFFHVSILAVQTLLPVTMIRLQNTTTAHVFTQISHTTVTVNVSMTMITTVSVMDPRSMDVQIRQHVTTVI